MLRCVHCCGRAVPGLAHLHGDPSKHLCRSCTKALLHGDKDSRKRDQTRSQNADGLAA